MQMCKEWLNGGMGALGPYQQRKRGLKSKEGTARVRQRQTESFLRPATRDITDFLLRGFSLIRKNSCVCVCGYVRACTCV